MREVGDVTEFTVEISAAPGKDGEINVLKCELVWAGHGN